MKNTTRTLFGQYVTKLALFSGVSASGLSASFAVEPSVQQKLETKVQESSEFLTQINVIPVTEMKGEILGLGIGGPIISNTDTNAADRETTDPSTLDDREYECRQNNSDTHLKYTKLDAWAKFPDFAVRIRESIIQRQALDRILVGFNGTHYAKTSNPIAFPLRQDVNIGWLEKQRTENPERTMTEVVPGSGKITVGENGDYKNLDALVYNMKQELLPTWARNDTELVVLIGSDLLDDKYFPLVNKNHNPHDTLAKDVILSTKRLGGLQAVTPPSFPQDKIVITRYDNLSIYYQEGGRRSMTQDNPKRDRIETRESSNDAYVIESLDYICMAENITFNDAAEAEAEA